MTEPDTCQFNIWIKYPHICTFAEIQITMATTTITEKASIVHILPSSGNRTKIFHVFCWVLDHLKAFHYIPLPESPYHLAQL